MQILGSIETVTERVDDGDIAAEIDRFRALSASELGKKLTGLSQAIVWNQHKRKDAQETITDCNAQIKKLSTEMHALRVVLNEKISEILER